ncbi:hypothetical protein IU479_27005 [Nocardia abscessus]|uniref:hypothetical protein n=1 Tax=Nocardia abscessus TaxID=120957 RepID=UPI0018961294|nr:hypothetical protein [Nocardia abscessus]MBF6221750.1 hypothetical protein [Nocardia abscessus]
MMRTPAGISVTVLGRGVRAAALAEVLAMDNAVTFWDEHGDTAHPRPRTEIVTTEFADTALARRTRTRTRTTAAPTAPWDRPARAN